MERDLSNSRAILIGGATFRPDAGIADLPAVHASVRAMADLLMTEDLCGWPPDRVEVVVDAPRADLDRRLRVAAAETTGVLLVYYVGRGLPTYTNRLALAVADVCGKGIPAALFMSMVRALLRNLAETQGDPALILRDLNNAVAQQNPKC